MDDAKQFGSRILGRTGMRVGSLGLSASYGMPTKAIEASFERGLNYFYFGSFRRPAFAEAVRNLRAHRDRMVFVVQSYTPVASFLEVSLDRGLKKAGVDYADILLLGLWNRVPPPRIFEACARLKEKGKIGWIAMSAHNRSIFASVAGGPPDVFHGRYNAVHRGCETEVFPALSDAGAGVVSYTATCWRQLLDRQRVPGGERVPTAADCYRFVLSNPAVHVCMTGTANMEQAEHALTALDLGPMNEDELAWMRRIGDAIHKSR